MAALKMFISFLVFSSSLPASWAIQPGAAPAQPAPLRQLEFGDINFLHTTDTHGWHAGHLLEPSFSADWGDYISFSEHLRGSLEAEGRDLLIIDTGDRIEGNGLYDSSSPRGIYTFPIFRQQQLDLLSIGNHELYKNSSAEDDYTQLVPYYGTHYLASNLDILDPQTGKQEQFASRYRVFTTKKQGIRVLAFGFIFDFTRNDKITFVQRVEDTITEAWFREAIASNDVDLIIVIGHVALRSFEFELIHKAIRLVKPDVPIQFFGGHFHIRDYRVFDNKAHSLASGRFMETIGFQSITNLNSSAPEFFRSYIDNNLYSLHYHSQTNSSTFDTEHGLKTSKAISKARAALNLDETFGCATQPYWMSRVPYPDNSSIYTLLTDFVLPDFLNLNPGRQNASRLLLTNTGAIRFDVFAGPFTRDSTFIVSPFTSNLSYIKDVPYRHARQLLPILNDGDPQTVNSLHTSTFHKQLSLSLDELPPPQQLQESLRRQNLMLLGRKQASQDFMTHEASQQARIDADFYESEASDDDYLNAHIGPGPTQFPFNAASESQHQNNHTKPPPSSPVLTPGYTTHDDLGTTGDDTIHTPISYYAVPNVIQTLVPGPHCTIDPNDNIELHLPTLDLPLVFSAEHNNPMDEALVDVVFNHFLAPYIIHILNVLPHVFERHLDIPVTDARAYTNEDVSNYVPGETFTTLLAKWVAENWKENCKDEDEFEGGKVRSGRGEEL